MCGNFRQHNFFGRRVRTREGVFGSKGNFWAGDSSEFGSNDWRQVTATQRDKFFGDFDGKPGSQWAGANYKARGNEGMLWLEFENAEVEQDKQGVFGANILVYRFAVLQHRANSSKL